MPAGQEFLVHVLATPSAHGDALGDATLKGPGIGGQSSLLVAPCLAQARCGARSITGWRNIQRGCGPRFPVPAGMTRGPSRPH